MINSVTYLIILHSYLNFEFRWHNKLVSFNGVKDCWLIRILTLVHLLLHLQLLLLSNVLVVCLLLSSNLNWLLHLLIDDLLLGIDLLRDLLIIFIFDLLLLIDFIHCLRCSYFLVSYLFLLLLSLIRLLRRAVYIANTIVLFFLWYLFTLSVSHL